MEGLIYPTVLAHSQTVARCVSGMRSLGYDSCRGDMPSGIRLLCVVIAVGDLVVLPIQ